MTEFLFRSDSYLRTIDATVAGIAPDGGIVLDRTIFYANSGGQPGDTGVLATPDGRAVLIATTIHPEGDKTRLVHVPAEGQPALAAGDRVSATIDWERRYKLMRMHTALHLATVVFPFPITGAAVGEDKGRIDFDMPEVPADIGEREARLNALVAAALPVSDKWITDEELIANPGLIKTMTVRPPMGQGRVRLVRIGDVDLQPCGGTHVKSTAEIGALKIGKIEKKGAQNRRVPILFA
ncbi:MAG TPA: alanyl-tRNA editing protein [Devosia sp.]|nr:alanyl-tRNA editing protein [Devosia sp.]